MNQQGTAKNVIKSKKPRTRRTRPTASISTAGSTTNPSAGNITSTTANSPPAPPAYGNACGVRSPCTIRTVRFVANNMIKEKKLRCFESKRTSVLYLERGWTMADEQEAVAAALLELAGSPLH